MPKADLNKEIKDHLDYYNTGNMKKIIRACEKLRKNPDYRVACNAILAAVYCGGRPQSEVFSLTVDQLDLENKVIELYPQIGKIINFIRLQNGCSNGFRPF